jgi:hypothetical protein
MIDSTTDTVLNGNTFEDCTQEIVDAAQTPVPSTSLMGSQVSTRFLPRDLYIIPTVLPMMQQGSEGQAGETENLAEWRYSPDELLPRITAGGGISLGSASGTVVSGGQITVASRFTRETQRWGRKRQPRHDSRWTGG